jgi:hypothetical protein
MTALPPAPAPDPERLRAELEKATSLVGTARRLLATGTMVDLAALESRVRQICDGIAGLERETGQTLRPGVEALIADIDRLDSALREVGPFGTGRWGGKAGEEAGR